MKKYYEVSVRLSSAGKARSRNELVTGMTYAKDAIKAQNNALRYVRLFDREAVIYKCELIAIRFEGCRVYAVYENCESILSSYVSDEVVTRKNSFFEYQYEKVEDNGDDGDD